MVLQPNPAKEKAIHHAMWLNFKYRIAKITFDVIQIKKQWAVLEEATAKEMKVEFLDILPKDFSKLSYDEIRHIRMDKDPLPHWENIFGMTNAESFNAKIKLFRANLRGVSDTEFFLFRLHKLFV